MPRILTIIPARGGSQRVPRKNLRPCGGKPLIQWTIEAARAADLEPVVSTEDEEISRVAAELGCCVLGRPPSLAGDGTPGVSVALHALDALGGDALVYLQPTSPLRTAEDIRAGLALVGDGACVAATPGVVWPVETHGGLVASVSQFELRLCGAFYGASARYLRERRRLYGPDTRVLVVPPERALDIDTEWDLHVADLVLKERGRS